MVRKEAAKFIVQMYSLLGSLTEGFLLFLLCKPELRFDSNQRMATILQTLTWCVVHTRALASVVDSYGDTESF